MHMRQYAYEDVKDAGSSAGVRGRHPLTTIGLQKWHSFIKTGDHAVLWDLLHPDAVFESPVVHTPQRGRDITFKYLVGATKVLGGPTFTYVGEWTSETGAVLEFTNDIDGITINGVDIITFDGDGRIVHFKVVVRPLKAINLLHRLMGEQLAKAP
jgi:SnoaL-like domain